MGELSGQAREAIAARFPWPEWPDDVADRALAARLGDGRTVGEWLDEAAVDRERAEVAERVCLWLISAEVDGAAFLSFNGDFWQTNDDTESRPLADVDPEAAALLARLGSGGGVPDGEGDE